MAFDDLGALEEKTARVPAGEISLEDREFT